MLIQLDLDKLKNKNSTIISSEEALKDVIPIPWSKEVLSSEKQVDVVTNFVVPYRCK